MWDNDSHLPIGHPLGVSLDLSLDAASGKLITTISGIGEISEFVFSPNGTLLAASTLTDIQLWTVGPSPQRRGTFRTDFVASVAFSPDASVLAVGTPSGTVLYDIGTGQQIGPLLPNHSSENGVAGVSVVWTANCTTLGVTGFKGPTELWNVGYLLSAKLPSSLCTLAGHTFSPAQWKQYAQGVPYPNVCP